MAFKLLYNVAMILSLIKNTRVQSFLASKLEIVLDHPLLESAK